MAAAWAAPASAGELPARPGLQGVDGGRMGGAGELPVRPPVTDSDYGHGCGA